MRLHPIVLGLLLAAGCSNQEQQTPASPPVDAPSPAPSADTPPAAPAPVATIPTRFRGEYAADADACTSPDHVSRLAIDASHLQFYESSGTVTAVDASGDRVGITAAFTGEGEQYQATYHFTLSGDGTVLTDTDHDMARRRCE